ncbi:hypothetical protein BaRGS_00002657 [Batillaria attramentaria]|uniref:Chitin-binding type-2 domain-containing protein n=1 Tax=Batillaria attramentaria TaxID=370345 RepID=A0ABD0M307_9CAEN
MLPRGFHVVAVLLSLAGSVDGEVYGYNIHLANVDCTGQPDGVAEIGCDGYIECVAQRMVKHICGDDEVFRRDSMTCSPVTEVGHSCTEKTVCMDLLDGRYADPGTSCQSYFTCHGHVFFGHGYCPGGLVFNGELQLCDWSSNVLFPCGTKVVTT